MLHDLLDDGFHHIVNWLSANPSRLIPGLRGSLAVIRPRASRRRGVIAGRRRNACGTRSVRVIGPDSIMSSALPAGARPKCRSAPRRPVPYPQFLRGGRDQKRSTTVTFSSAHAVPCLRQILSANSLPLSASLRENIFEDEAHSSAFMFQ